MGNACQCDRPPAENTEINLLALRGLKKGNPSLVLLPGTYEFPLKYKSLLSKVPTETPPNLLKSYDQGFYKLPSGIVYQGTWDNEGRATGYGTLYFPNHGIYSGHIEDFEPQGEGHYIAENGDVFTGKFKGIKSCEGVMKTSEGAEITGTFIDGVVHGNGSEVWKDGTTFEGNYVHGQKTGFGKMFWYDENGKVSESYEGEFVENNFHGKGTYKWGKKKSYTGQWRDGKMNGEGEFFWKDGRTFKGSFNGDLKEGYGEFQWIDGRCWKGDWVKGEKHGFGLSIDSAGVERLGEWKNDKRVRWLEKEEAENVKKELKRKALEKKIL